MTEFNDFMGTLIYDKHWSWLELIIASLSELEIGIYLLTHTEVRNRINRCTITSSKDEIWYAYQVIPKNSFYCETCPFWAYSKIAKFFYGEQTDGYCFFLGKGDFSYIRPTDLLWDQVKCCGLFEDQIEDISE